MEYKFMTAFNFEPRFAIQFIDDNGIEYGYDDFDDLVQNQKYDLIKDLIKIHFEYEDDYMYSELLTDAQKDELTEIVFNEIMKGKNVQLSLDI